MESIVASVSLIDCKRRRSYHFKILMVILHNTRLIIVSVAKRYIKSSGQTISFKCQTLLCRFQKGLFTMKMLVSMRKYFSHSVRHQLLDWMFRECWYQFKHFIYFQTLWVMQKQTWVRISLARLNSTCVKRLNSMKIQFNRLLVSNIIKIIHHHRLQLLIIQKKTITTLHQMKVGLTHLQRLHWPKFILEILMNQWNLQKMSSASRIATNLKRTHQFHTGIH